MTRRGAIYCLQRDRAIKRGKASVITYGQSQEVDIRYFLVPADHRPSEERFVSKGDRVRPEMMMRCSREIAEAFRYFRRRCCNCGVSGVAEDANASVDGDGTRRPSTFFVQSKPPVGVFVIDVTGIE